MSLSDAKAAVQLAMSAYPHEPDKYSTPAKARHWVDIIHGRVTAWLILFVSLVITVAAWKISSDYAEQRARDRFEFQVDAAKWAIEKRMLDYEQMLRGGVGLFRASGTVTRAMWHDYVSTLEVNKNFPGVQGVGFSKWILPPEKDAHTREVQREGFSNYMIIPPGERAEYTSIVYLEPFAERNLRAFGFDMYSEPTRRKAMKLARDTGQSAVSGRVTLLQETDTDVQYGFLMYLPVYRQPAITVEERRQNLVGFVYSPFRIRDLMNGILGAGLPEVNFEIYDAETIIPERLMFSSSAANIDNATVPVTDLQLIKQLHIGNHAWAIRFAPTELFLRNNAASQPLIIAIGGIVIDVLLFWIILSQARLRAKATSLAEKMVHRLGERELHFKAITDTANDGIVTADSDGKITYYNKAAERIFGFSSQEIVGRKISCLMPARGSENNLARFVGATDFGGNGIHFDTMEMLALHKSGKEFPIEISLSNWRIGGKSYVNGIVRDITERKKVERMKNEFVSTVSHELRTPLTAVKGAIGLAVGGILGDLSKDTVELLSVADKNIDRLSRLINDMLDLDKIESGRLRMDMLPYPLLSLLRQAVDNNNTVAMQASVSLELANVVDVPVNVDVDRFQQVMTNLISNAVKFSSDGGAVIVSSTLMGDDVRISVEDKGVGIPDEFRAQIFNKFAQADASDRRLKRGTGLGLNISKAIVEKFGGSIHYESTLGVGTTFFVDLPVSCLN